MRDPANGPFGLDRGAQTDDVAGRVLARKRGKVDHDAAEPLPEQRDNFPRHGETVGAVHDPHPPQRGQGRVVTFRVQHEHAVARLDPAFGQQPGQMALPAAGLPFDEDVGLGAGDRHRAPVGKHLRHGSSAGRGIAGAARTGTDRAAGRAPRRRRAGPAPGRRASSATAPRCRSPRRPRRPPAARGRSPRRRPRSCCGGGSPRVRGGHRTGPAPRSPRRQDHQSGPVVDKLAIQLQAPDLPGGGLPPAGIAGEQDLPPAYRRAEGPHRLL